jgi:aminoglycoside phosphotransferase (APT) family kinase protein
MSNPRSAPAPLLTREKAATLIKDSFPNVDATELRHLGSGATYDVFQTGDDWAFRFPRVNWSGDLFDTEAAIHQFVAEIIPAQIRIPRVELLAPPSRQFPYPIAGHRFIPGVAADEVDEKLLPTLAREIALLLNALHSTPTPVAGAAGIHEVGMDDGRRAWFETGVNSATTLRGVDPVIDTALDWLKTAPLPLHVDAPLHPVHGDLDPQHILVNPSTGFITGVIDWTETHLDDAATDFVFLVTWRGWHFAEEVLHLYPRAVDKEFRTRLRSMARLMSLMWLGHAHAEGRELGGQIRGVHNAFE